MTFTILYRLQHIVLFFNGDISLVRLNVEVAPRVILLPCFKHVIFPYQQVLVTKSVTCSLVRLIFEVGI